MARSVGRGDKRPFAGNLSVEPNMPVVKEFVSTRPVGPIPITGDMAQVFSGSGYKPASPPGRPDKGITPSGVTKSQGTQPIGR